MSDKISLIDLADKEAMDALFTRLAEDGCSDITFRVGTPLFIWSSGQLLPMSDFQLNQTTVERMVRDLYGSSDAIALLNSGNSLDFSYEVRVGRKQRQRFRVNVTPVSVAGSKAIEVTMRALPHKPPKLADLGIEPKLAAALFPKEGIIWVTGATGSGKSTLLAAITREKLEKESANCKIVTFEAPIEFVYGETGENSYIAQSEVPTDLRSFGEGVRGAMRRAITDILVGETRDYETVAASLEAANTGHSVQTTVHTNGVAETCSRVLDLFPPDQSSARKLDFLFATRAIVNQTLARKIGGGRVALREFLVFDQTVRDCLSSTPKDHWTFEIERLLREHGQPMAVAARRALNDGLITEEEASRYLKAGESLTLEAAQ